MVRAGNLITNNLSNAYAAGAVSLRGGTYVEFGIPGGLTVHVRTYAPAKYRKAITDLA